MKREAIVRLTRGAVIGALYAALTLLLAPISFGTLQFRLSEMLTVLPLFFPEAIPGLFLGCLFSNLFSPNIVFFDVIFGSAATLLAAFLTSRFSPETRAGRLLAPLPPVVINALVIGILLTFSTTSGGASSLPVFLIRFCSVAFGEAVVCYGAGLPLIHLIKNRFFKNPDSHRKDKK